MCKSKKVFAVHPGEILKTEFMEPMGKRESTSHTTLNASILCHQRHSNLLARMIVWYAL